MREIVFKTHKVFINYLNNWTLFKTEIKLNGFIYFGIFLYFIVIIFFSMESTFEGKLITLLNYVRDIPVHQDPEI